MNAVAADTQNNWQAYLELRLAPGEDKTRLIPIKRYGPLSVQRPFYPEGDICHVYLLHPPGGVVGGDRLQLHVGLEAQSKALLTTPGATKFYLSAGETAEVRQRLTLQQNAELEFLPQENIYFPGSLVNAKTTLNLVAGSSALLWEKHCFGRPVNHEFYATGMLISELEVRLDDKLLFIEKQRIDAAEIKSASGLRHYPVIGTFLAYSNRLDKALLEALREITPLAGFCGVTQPTADLLVARYMGASTDDLNAYFIRLLGLLRPVVLLRELCRPRIWNT